MATLNSYLNVDYYEEGMSLGHAKINELVHALMMSGTIVVEDKDLTAAPGSPTDYAMYIPAGTPSGGDAWAGKGGSAYLAMYYGLTWYFRPLRQGEVFTIKDEKKVVVVGSGSAPDFETVYTYT